MNTSTPAEVFAVDFAMLAREIAMNLFDIHQILRLHQLDEDEWARIQSHPDFIRMLAQMQQEWDAAENTPSRIKAKASTGLESVLEVFIRDITDPKIPLGQRVEAGKFLAKMGEIGEKAGQDGERFSIVLNIGETHKTIDVIPNRVEAL